jgi:hypothetical protein
METRTIESPSIGSYEPVSPSTGGDIAKNFIIMVLLVILILSLLGINIFTIFGNALQNFIDIFNPIISKTLADLGYASGTVLDRSSDIVADAGKTGIDILNGTVQSVSDLLVKASGRNPGSELDRHINQPPTQPPHPPAPNDTTSPIQSGSSSSKSNWCLVGEYNGTRGCISVSDQDKCLSGQIFPSQQQCLNPNLSQNKS